MTFAIIDAFCGEFNGRLLRGNPAAVVLLSGPKSDAWLQDVAQEFNLSETAFLWLDQPPHSFDLRWFTPQCEVNLCGHATLAAAHFLWESTVSTSRNIYFRTKSGVLVCARDAQTGAIGLTFPAIQSEPREMPDALALAFGFDKGARFFSKQHECFFAGEDWLVAVHETVLQNAAPKLELLHQIEGRGVILTAQAEWPGWGYDFMSRFWAPKCGIPEDPVTGSAHCALAPFWGQRLGKNSLQAIQFSARGGFLKCEWGGNNVILRGEAKAFARGELVSV